MTGAYAGILNGGSAVKPYGLIELRLLGDREPLMGAGGGIGERVIQERAARSLTYMMEKVVSDGSGGRAAIDGWQLAGKTGTTQGARDAWFIGFSADYVAGIWMGYDDNSPLTGVTGGGLPAEIWHEVMVRVLEGVPPRALPMDVPGAGTKTFDPGAQLGGGSSGSNSTGSIIENVLRDIFGGGSGGGSSGQAPASPSR